MQPTLFIASTLDRASMNIAKALLRSRGGRSGGGGESEIWRYLGRACIQLPLLRHNSDNNHKVPGFAVEVVTDMSGGGSDGALLGVWQSESRSAYLWIQERSMLFLNYPETSFYSLFNYGDCPPFPPPTASPSPSSSASPPPDESTVASPPVTISNIIFLSKHSAASGQPSLTVHPIGIPYLTSNLRGGGIPGRCAPANPLAALLYRAIYSAWGSWELQALKEQFTVTLEATHHGPFSNLPCAFIEIGSTEAQWGIPEAGELWAQTLIDLFHLTSLPSNNSSSSDANTNSSDNNSSDNNSSNKSADSSKSDINDLYVSRGATSEIDFITNSDRKYIILMSFGSGHYVPKMNDGARLGNWVLLGHSIANYGFEPPPLPLPRWRCPTASCRHNCVNEKEWNFGDRDHCVACRASKPAAGLDASAACSSSSSSNDNGGNDDSSILISIGGKETSKGALGSNPASSSTDLHEEEEEEEGDSFSNASDVVVTEFIGWQNVVREAVSATRKGIPVSRGP